jgi:hypothetical protein
LVWQSLSCCCCCCCILGLGGFGTGLGRLGRLVKSVWNIWVRIQSSTEVSLLMADLSIVGCLSIPRLIRDLSATYPRLEVVLLEGDMVMDGGGGGFSIVAGTSGRYLPNPYLPQVKMVPFTYFTSTNNNDELCVCVCVCVCVSDQARLLSTFTSHHITSVTSSQC